MNLLFEVLNANVQVTHTQWNQLCLPENVECFFVVVVVVALEERRQAFEDVEGLLNLRVDADVHGSVAVADLGGQVLKSLFH